MFALQRQNLCKIGACPLSDVLAGANSVTKTRLVVFSMILRGVILLKNKISLFSDDPAGYLIVTKIQFVFLWMSLLGASSVKNRVFVILNISRT